MTRLPTAAAAQPSGIAAPESHAGPGPLLDGDTVDEYRDAVSQGTAVVAAALSGAERPFSGISPEDLTATIARIDLDAPLADVGSALAEVERIYLRDAIYFHHPRYLGHLNCPVAIPALLAEAILSPINSSLDTWDQSGGATLIERRLIDWTAARIGLGEHADGVFTSGGTQSNLQALLIAREEAGRQLGVEDPPPPGSPPDNGRLRVLVSDVGHFSIETAAGLLGLDPRRAIVDVACDAQRRMRPDALRDELARCHAEQLVPMAVVATAGTTDFGSIDPLREIAGVCAQAGVWMHVDAAYGCGLLVSRRRALLDGIERASSVTVDFHKSFFQPISSSAVLVRDRATLRHVTHHADYLNPVASLVRGLPNQVDKSLQTTRRFDALKLWLTLRIMGADQVGALFDKVVDLAAAAWELIDADDRFEVVMRPTLSTLVFRYVPEADAFPELCDRANAHAREALMASGRGVVAATKVGGHQYLKFTLLNPRTEMSDVEAVLGLVAGHAARFMAEATQTEPPPPGRQTGAPA